MDFSLIKPISMDFFIDMGFINSDSPFVDDAMVIYQLPYLFICIHGRGALGLY
jgi:hypothetical protein